LLEDDDVTREEFIKKNPQTVLNIIKYLKELAKQNQDGTERLLAIKCFAKISEVDCENISRYLIDLEDENDSNYFWKDILFFFQNPLQFDDLCLDQIKLKLAILVNITRKDSANVIKLFGHFKALDKHFLNIVSSISVLPVDTSQLVIHLLLNISSCKELIKSLVNSLEITSAIEKLLLLFESNNELSKLELISIIFNFLHFDCLHPQLLDAKLNLTLKLLYPLSGSTSLQFEENEMEKLNVNLQYLDKEVESDLNLVKCLVSCLLLCCNRKEGRDLLKANGAYYILRELHKKEYEDDFKEQIEDVVGMLIRDESEYDNFPALLKLNINHIDPDNTV